MIGIVQESVGMGHESIYMQGREIIEAGINLLLAVREAPDNAGYRKEIDQEIRYQRTKIKEMSKNELRQIQ
jgi:hypothetical protein